MEDLTYAIIEGRKQAFHTVDVYKKYIPGMENCWMSHSAAIIGTRESRRIAGKYVITEDDLMEQKEFNDSIGYGSFFTDVKELQTLLRNSGCIVGDNLTDLRNPQN